MSSSSKRTKHWIVIGVGAFIAIDVAIVVWSETRPKAAVSTVVAEDSAPLRMAHTASGARPAVTASGQSAPTATLTAASEPVAIVAPTAPPTSGTAGLLKEAPSAAEMKALADTLFAAIRDNDEAALRAMAPPGAEADETTTAMFMHQRNLNHLREVAPQLEALASEKGIDEVMAFRNGEVRVKLYRATNAPSGKSLSIRRTDAGQWYVAQEVYMRD